MNLELTIPEGAEKVEVFARGTKSTNGKNEYEHKQEENKLIIKAENKERDGKINWNKNEKDTYIITYTFEENQNLENSQIQIKDTKKLLNNLLYMIINSLFIT